jgi:hypothetical protein
MIGLAEALGGGKNQDSRLRSGDKFFGIGMNRRF